MVGLEEFIHRLFDDWGDKYPPYPLYVSMVKAYQELFREEYQEPKLRSEPFAEPKLKDRQAIYEIKINSDEALATFEVAVRTSLLTLHKNLPFYLTEEEFKAAIDEKLTHTTIPLHDWISKSTIQAMMLPFFNKKVVEHHLLRDLSNTLADNFGATKKTNPSDFKGTTAEAAATYLRDTPLLPLFKTLIPFTIPRKKYVEHGAIFAPTGHGKTRLLEHTIVSFLNEPNPPAMFIMDSMGAMLKKLERLSSVKDRLVILDPTDENPPALNFFKLNGGSKAQQTALFFYLFKAIDQGLTQRQATMVAYLVELMQAIPDATLDTLRAVCESKAPLYTDYYDQLEPIGQDFFQNQFHGKDPLINQTKQQIAARLYTVGRNHVFNRMFGAKENKFDAFQCMQERKVVLVNTDRLYLGDEASAIFGRFVIAQCLAAALARAAITDTRRHLALLIVDEAKAYLDEQAEKILSDARQFGLGMLLATQAPHQLPEGVQRELATNTTIKMVGPVSYSVASTLARDMHTTPEFIQGMSKKDFEYTEFATYVRGLTPHALRLQIPMGTLAAQPTMTDEAWRAMRARNRERYGTHKAPEGASREPLKAPDPPIIHAKVNKEPKKKEVNKSESKDHTKPDPDY